MSKKIPSATLLIFFFTVLSANAGNLLLTIKLPISISHLRPDEGPTDASDSKLPASPADPDAAKIRLPFDLSRIDSGVIKEFERAWRYSKSGRSDAEGLVLIFRKLDGSYFGVQGAFTNEYKKVSFKWVPNAIAIVHTHPNDVNPEPNANDCQVADHLGVPMFTLTARGMFMYDPRTKLITRVMECVDWLDPAKWETRGQK
ncbi:MAG TPA: hypothetical protein VID27_22510 [Blastocatellia bacterium]|jgi:hypothetical protein